MSSSFRPDLTRSIADLGDLFFAAAPAADLAALVGMDGYGLSRAVKRATGLSQLAWRQNARIVRARHMLDHGMPTSSRLGPLPRFRCTNIQGRFHPRGEYSFPVPPVWRASSECHGAGSTVEQFIAVAAAHFLALLILIPGT
ncbi:helix-turn-helix domain-containing protein [Brevibacterium sp. 50QC2O2]|uniref:helix-turn-helix domain-containing protein n=1 Tax=Brevibacterium TaxID=1696 RepID=UPI00211CC3A2|nr:MULTISPECIES: helix-turn-helix domain-containing protein [unclassified Brevibacterium]MCQ9368653.1 helix-turn-helix domain-containing protein [Brevibacterium sp. 91QC2O2]MCQ9386399.1 helix-turn-helix domain-containing protein [Brevibacterium sp. 68QC2CO]MCQ9389486.1 helix-turn-helix domain-containing protein [Brevibacterium sp. 50QC2O2]